MLVEVSFAKSVNERRHVVIIVRTGYKAVVTSFYYTRPFLFNTQKHMDAFASAFGFFLIGFDSIARYSSMESARAHFFSVSDPLLWFFKVRALDTFY